MAKQRLDKAFVSDHDKFLFGFDKKQGTLSESQRKEIDKHERIFALRDGIPGKSPSILKRALRVFFN